jgi:hypothetical protein
MASDDGMANQLKRIWKDAVVSSSRYYPRIYVEELKNTTRNLSLGNGSSGCESI